MFSSCGIETITIPDNVTVIGKKAFFASGLTDISIPAGVTDIGDRAFSQTRLTSVTVPATIRSFGKYIFSECVDLHTAVLAEGITRVSDGMFRDCTNLADVTLPQTLTAIAQQAFSGCTDLEHIALPETTVKYGACAFSGTYLTDVRSRPDELPRQGCAEQYARPAADHASGWTDERRRRAVFGRQGAQRGYAPVRFDRRERRHVFRLHGAAIDRSAGHRRLYRRKRVFRLHGTHGPDVPGRAGVVRQRGPAGLQQPDGDHGPHRRARAAGGGIQRLQSARQRQPARGSDEHRPHRVPILHQPAGDLHSRQRTGHSRLGV